MEALSKIDELVNSYHAAKERLVNEVKPHFIEVFKSIFEKYPEVNNVAWSQYTPYFMDGEVCEFSVNCYDLYINNTYCEDQYSDGSSEFQGLLTRMPSEIMLGIFGDHVKVTVHKGGVMETEEYDHD